MAKLSINVGIRSANMENARIIVENLFKIVPLIATEFRRSSYEAAVSIAPRGPKPNVPDDSADFYASTGYTLVRKPKNRTQSLVDSISIEKSSLDSLSFSLGAKSSSSDGVKVIMQEYGYPYDTTGDDSDEDDEDFSEKTNRKSGFKPYPPNPKNAKRYNKLINSDIRGVGYLRAGLVAVSKSFAYGKPGNRLPSVSKNEVINYQNVVRENIVLAVQKFVTDYAKGKINLSFKSSGGSSTYSTGSSKISLDTNDVNTALKGLYGNRLELGEFTPVSKYASRFGSITVDFDGLLDIYSNFGTFNTSTLSGRSSFTGRPKAPRRDFLI